MSNKIFRVCAIGPSTDITGVALVVFEEGKPTQILFAHGLSGKSRESNSLTARLERIAEISDDLDGILAETTKDGKGMTEFDVAYEVPFMRGTFANEALPMATGAYLNIPNLRRRRVWPIQVSTAKAAWGGSKLPRKEAKPAVVAWANKEFNINLNVKQDGIADALAVAVAAYGQ
jgi:Holliday junction resolvasome RuvABC endonuclease subunit